MLRKSVLKFIALHNLLFKLVFMLLKKLDLFVNLWPNSPHMPNKVAQQNRTIAPTLD